MHSFLHSFSILFTLFIEKSCILFRVSIWKGPGKALAEVMTLGSCCRFLRQDHALGLHRLVLPALLDPGPRGSALGFDVMFECV